MSTCEVRLTGREQIAHGTMAFHFEKPASFTFKPGQAVEIALPHAVSGGESMQRAFSLVSAPFEPKLTVATRMRDSAFKRTLADAPIGTHVALDGPFGSLTLHNKRTRRALFIAGGIGITPFMSILRQAAHDALQHKLLLLYSNRRPEDAAFLGELQHLERRNPNFRLVATMTEAENSAQPWVGEKGFIDEALLKKIVGDVAEPIYYVVGPPAMVTSMRQTLNAAGADDDDIRSEEFYGYEAGAAADALPVTDSISCC